jgi:hypothetical protein
MIFSADLPTVARSPSRSACKNRPENGSTLAKNSWLHPNTGELVGHFLSLASRWPVSD